MSQGINFDNNIQILFTCVKLSLTCRTVPPTIFVALMSIRNVLLLLLLIFIGSTRALDPAWKLDHAHFSDCSPSPIQVSDSASIMVREALLSTRYKTLDDLRNEIDIEYVAENRSLFCSSPAMVLITHCSEGRKITSIIKAGVNEGDFRKARDGDIWDKIRLGIKSPYVVFHRKDLLRVYNLARRRHKIFGQGDVAFFDLAEQMVCHILDKDLRVMPCQDTTEKGYINTFNHVTAQAFVTTFFSETLADFIADSHERFYMPELISGKFTQRQLYDDKNNPIDNYVDIVNNEWGQELGKRLKRKYKINRNTKWSPTLMANYLNDIQSYYSWSFGLDFLPFLDTDEVVVKFSSKINRVMENAPL